MWALCLVSCSLGRLSLGAWGKPEVFDGTSYIEVMGGGKSLSSSKDAFLMLGAGVTDEEDKEVLSLSLFRELMVFLYLSGESDKLELLVKPLLDTLLLSPPMLNLRSSDTSVGLTAGSLEVRLIGRLTIGTNVSGMFG